MSSQNNVLWISEPLVRAIHEIQIKEHGGILGVRDEALLNSGLARAQNAAAYGKPDIAELAALYALGIIKNHPFIDGNKRVGAVLLELFLELNGSKLNASDAQLLANILAVTASELSDRAFIEWVRENSSNAEPSIGTTSLVDGQAP